ncbi:hypothetical protein GDO78_006536 [Eleutherodactylus coqui]|uniref:Uncharacterized protein n=1 Tax=Eleutherodactylus coqui TaxID=57060 RepID=A0A8J6FNI1_ELECQ|nr:hypothetical protein GDO78_006536 [Eleutherodactylus coqui]
MGAPLLRLPDWAVDVYCPRLTMYTNTKCASGSPRSGTGLCFQGPGVGLTSILFLGHQIWKFKPRSIFRKQDAASSMCR